MAKRTQKAAQRAVRTAPAKSAARRGAASGAERTAGSDRDSDKNIVHSLAKGFRILETFTAREPELTLADVARKAGVDNATAFRFLNTLVQTGYVERVPNARLFRLTTKVLDLGFNAIAHSDLRTQARPILRDLVGEINEAASVGVLEGANIIYIERIQAGLARLGVDTRIGSRVPAYATAIGHAVLAWLPRAAQIAILESQPRPQLTATTQTKLDALFARFVKVKARGYAVSDQETVSGLYVLAAPILDSDGVPLAGISIAAPAIQTSLNDFESAGAKPIMQAARALSRALQASGGFIHRQTA